MFAQCFPVELPANICDNSNEIDLLQYKDTVEMTSEFKANFENTGVMIDGTVLTEKTKPIQETPITLGEIRETRTGLDSYILTGDKKEKFTYLRGAKKIARTKPNGEPYFYSEGSMSPYDSLDLPGRTMLTSESSVNRSTHIIPDMETGELRILTPIEAERLQGFPDNWTNTGMPEKRRYFMMGNALVTNVINRIEPKLHEIINNE